MNESEMKERLNLLEQFMASTNTKAKRAKNMCLCTDEQLSAVCEACFNVLNQNVPLTPAKKKQLKRKLDPIKLELRKISDPKVSLKLKRKILAQPQTGSGVFTLLASAVIPAIISALASK